MCLEKGIRAPRKVSVTTDECMTIVSKPLLKRSRAGRLRVEGSLNLSLRPHAKLKAWVTRWARTVQSIPRPRLPFGAKSS
jgi:hypothetical protein